VIVVKIEGTSISPIGSVQATTKVSQVNKNDGGSKQDKLAVSENAQVFQKLLQKLKELPDIREGKVKIIAEQISNGEFKLDADSLATSMLPLGKMGEK